MKELGAEWRQRKIIFEDTSFGVLLLFEQCQNSTGYNTEHENKCSFPSWIGNSITKFVDMQLFVKNSPYMYVYQIYKEETL